MKEILNKIKSTFDKKNYKIFYQYPAIITNLLKIEKYVNEDFETILQLLEKNNCYLQYQNGILNSKDLSYFESNLEYGSYDKYFMCNKVLFDILKNKFNKNTEWKDDNTNDYKIVHNPLMDKHKLSNNENGFGMLLDLQCFIQHNHNFNIIQYCNGILKGVTIK